MAALRPRSRDKEVAIIDVDKPNGAPRRLPGQKQAETDLEALRILDDRLKNRWSIRQLAQRWNRSPKTVEKRLNQAIELSKLTDARNRVITDLLPMSHTIYAEGLKQDTDPDKQERLARDVMFGTGVLSKNAKPPEDVPVEEMTLEIWRAQWQSSGSGADEPATEGEVTDAVLIQSHPGLQLPAHESAFPEDGDPEGTGLPGNGPDESATDCDRDLPQ